MKRSVLARPNLKIFLLGAVLLLAVQDMLTRGHSQSNLLAQARVRTGTTASDELLEALRAEAIRHPTPEIYMQLSEQYHRRGDIKKALTFLRRAEKVADQSE